MSRSLLSDPTALQKAIEEAGSQNRFCQRHGIPRSTLYSALKRHQNTQDPATAQHDSGDAREILPLLRSSHTVAQLCDAVDRSPKTVRAWLGELRDRGYNLIQTGDQWELSKVPDPNPAVVDHRTGSRSLDIALVSDTHLCSKWVQLTHLNDFYDRCAARGIRDVYHSGDLLAGEGIYRGQTYDIHVHGFDEQVAYAIQHYPRRDGIQTHVVAGNHDLVFLKRGGADPIKALARERQDISYLGPFSAWVQLTDDCDLYLLHPDGAPAYAVSYKLQKLIESFQGGRKPHLVSVGHWHQRCYIFQRDVHALMPGAFELQTAYEMRKMLQPQVGGVIAHMEFDEAGTITSFVPEFVSYVRHVDDDWRNYKS